MTEARMLTDEEEVKHPNMDCVVIIGGIRRYFTATALYELATEIGECIGELQKQGAYDDEFLQG